LFPGDGATQVKEPDWPASAGLVVLAVV